MGLAVLLVSFLAGRRARGPVAVPRRADRCSPSGCSQRDGLPGDRAQPPDRPRRTAARRRSSPSSPSIAITLIASLIVLAPLAALGLDAALAGRDDRSRCWSRCSPTSAWSGCWSSGPARCRWAEMRVRRPDAAARPRPARRAPCSPSRSSSSRSCSAAVLGRFLEPAPSPLPEPGDAAGLLAQPRVGGDPRADRRGAVLPRLRDDRLGPLGRARARRSSGARCSSRIAHVLTLFDASFAIGRPARAVLVPALLPVGIALGWVFLARRSLYASIGLHAAFNAHPGLLLAATRAARRRRAQASRGKSR